MYEAEERQEHKIACLYATHESVESVASSHTQTHTCTHTCTHTRAQTHTQTSWHIDWADVQGHRIIQSMILKTMDRYLPYTLRDRTSTAGLPFDGSQGDGRPSIGSSVQRYM